jgi:NAD(P)-dependent dehydrogenase (short-subunit alcohol dehydrogenase family)
MQMSKQVVLTGGATGIGEASAARLLERGHRVVGLDVNEPPSGLGAEFVHCDLGDPSSIDAALGELEGEYDALVNVASSAGRDWPSNAELVGALLDTADFASGVEWLAEHRDAWVGNPYKFSKQVAAAYTYRAARLVVEYGVRVNCVNPGATETRLTPEFRELIGSEAYDWIGDQLGGTGTPAEVAEVIEFLAVGECGWLNGVEITVDGGYYAGLVGGWIAPDPALGHAARQRPILPSTD